MGIGSKEEFRKRFPRGPRVHTVGEGEDQCFVREMTAHERSEFDLELDTKKFPKALSTIRERLVVLCQCDEEGNRIWAKEDLGEVGELPMSVLDPIFEKIREVNGLKVTPVETIRKNSETTPGDS